MKKFLITLLAALSIAGTVVGINEPCLLSAEELEFPEDKVKICFEKKKDYKNFKKDMVDAYWTGEIIAQSDEWKVIVALINKDAKHKEIKLKKNESMMDALVRNL